MTVPVTVIIGNRDQVEHEPALRKTFARFLSQATLRVLQGIAHLSPLEAPSWDDEFPQHVRFGS